MDRAKRALWPLQAALFDYLVDRQGYSRSTRVVRVSPFFGNLPPGSRARQDGASPELCRTLRHQQALAWSLARLARLMRIGNIPWDERQGSSDDGFLIDDDELIVTFRRFK